MGMDEMFCNSNILCFNVKNIAELHNKIEKINSLADELKKEIHQLSCFDIQFEIVSKPNVAE